MTSQTPAAPIARELVEWHRADYDPRKVAAAKVKGEPYPEPIYVVMTRRDGDA